MTDTVWGFVALGGLAVVLLGNVLRMRRTDDKGGLGQLIVASEEATGLELALNRLGIVMFFVGIVLLIAV